MTAADRARGLTAALRAGAGVVLLLALIVAVHAPALRLGLFMDDLAHWRQLREAPWTLRGLTDACRLDLVGGTIELWWLPDVTLRFFRPLAFGLMKAVYTLSDWRPGPMHAASLAWHAAVCLLVMQAARGLGVRPLWAFAAAALFAIHPGHVVTVQWIACQSELMVSTFLLAATLLHLYGAGRPAWLAAAAVCFLLALGCRENAIVFPALALALDWLLRRRVDRRAAVGSIALVLVAAAYLAVRTAMLGGVAAPPKPYVVPIADPDFARYVFDKLLYSLLGQFLLAPSVPLAGLAYLREHALLFYGLAAPLALALAGVAWRGLRSPSVGPRPAVAAAFGVVWLICTTAPLLPVFESPHHLYLPGLGWALVIAAALDGLAGAADSAAWRRARFVVAAMSCVLFGAVCARLTTWFAWGLEAAEQVQDTLVAEVLAAPRPPRDGDTLYFANFPLVAHYAKLALERDGGLRGIRVVPLTWSPRLLGVVTPNALDWIDARTCELAIAGDRYFAGPLGELVRRTTGEPPPDVVDRRGDLGFNVITLERNADGVSRFRFEFAAPPAAGPLHFFYGSRARWAYQAPAEHAATPPAK